MTDPEVISDRERYAAAGRAYRQLQPAAELASQWRRARDDAAGAEELICEDGEDPEPRELLSTARARIEQLEEEIRLAMIERDPNDEKSVIVEIQGGAGGDEAGLWAGDLYRMLSKVRRAPGLSDRGDGRRRGQVHVRDSRIWPPPALLGVQVRGRHPPRAACPRDRVPGAHPHLDRDRRGAARSRGGRRGDQPERSADRRLPLDPARAGSRSTRPTRPCASRTSRRA